jgi:hypothetical protein
VLRNPLARAARMTADSFGVPRRDDEFQDPFFGRMIIKEVREWLPGAPTRAMSACLTL